MPRANRLPVGFDGCALATIQAGHAAGGHRVGLFPGAGLSKRLRPRMPDRWQLQQGARRLSVRAGLGVRVSRHRCLSRACLPIITPLHTHTHARTRMQTHKLLLTLLVNVALFSMQSHGACGLGAPGGVHDGGDEAPDRGAAGDDLPARSWLGGRCSLRPRKSPGWLLWAVAPIGVDCPAHRCR